MACIPRPVVMVCKTFPDQKDLIKDSTITLNPLVVNLKKASIGFVMIDFFSNIFFESPAEPGSELLLRFTLHRKYKGVEEQLGNRWIFRREFDDNTLTRTEDTFNFRFCDFNPCCESYSYFVRIFVFALQTGVSKVDINNISMSAIAQ